jgi:hypothetical protein
MGMNCIFKLSAALLTSGASVRDPTVPVNGVEKRTNPRAKLARKLRVRPSDVYEDDFEEVATSINVSKRGIYFQTDLPTYRVALRLFVTYPFTSVDDPMKTEWIGEVMRVDTLPNNKHGIAVHLHSRI